MTIKLVVGYRTRAVDNLDTFVPKFTANRSLKNDEKIKEDLEEKKQAFMAEAKDQPYTGTFDEVFISDPKHEKVGRWSYMEGRHPGGPKQPVSVAVRTWIMKLYPDAWGKDTHEIFKPQVIFMGFDPRTFLKIFGIECSLPGIDKPLPPRMWYSNSDHRDIAEAVMPKDFKRLSFEIVLKRRRPLKAEDAAIWDENIKDWTGPGQFPEKDAKLTVELATQLGFLND